MPFRSVMAPGWKRPAITGIAVRETIVSLHTMGHDEGPALSPLDHHRTIVLRDLRQALLIGATFSREPLVSQTADVSLSSLVVAGNMMSISEQLQI